MTTITNDGDTAPDTPLKCGQSSNRKFNILTRCLDMRDERCRIVSRKSFTTSSFNISNVYLFESPLLEAALGSLGQITANNTSIGLH